MKTRRIKVDRILTGAIKCMNFLFNLVVYCCRGIVFDIHEVFPYCLEKMKIEDVGLEDFKYIAQLESVHSAFTRACVCWVQS